MMGERALGAIHGLGTSRIRATIKRLGLNVDELLTGSNMATNKTKTGRR